MKTRRLSIFLLACATAASAAVARGFPPHAAAEPGKRALLVGISQYKRGGPDDMADLHSGADVAAIATMLTRRFGFSPDDVKILSAPEKTTHEAIVGAFRAWLIAPTGVDDIVYFHYSGHGTTVPDDDGDELDGLDESLVPSDYVSKRDGSRNIRDDEIARLLEDLSEKHPGNVTLTFDCCYSGTATRAGRMLVRGQSWPGDDGGSRRPPVTDGVPDGGSGIAPASHPAARGYVVISATSQGQLAAETEDDDGNVMGLFTYALIAAAQEADAATTYRDLYERMGDLMLRRNRRQTPQVEGELDRLLFAGAGVTPPAYIPVTGDPGGGVFLEAGSLQGITRDSRYALFPAGTRDFASAAPLAEAVVSRVDLSYAQLALAPEATVSIEDLRAARAIEVEHSYGDNRLKVDLSALDASASWDGLRETLSDLPLLDTGPGAAERWDVRLDAPTGDAIRLERRDGSELAAAPVGPELSARIARALEGESRWRFVSGLENDDPYAQVDIELRLAPVEVRLAAAGYAQEVLGDLDLPPGDGGLREIPAGTHVMLELRNTGFLDAYVTVLDLRGEGEIGPLWPYPGLRVQDNRIVADGQWVRIPAPFIFRIDGPSGAEMFKAIATAEPADFSPLLDRDAIRDLERNRSAGPRDDESPLGQLLRAATLGERSTTSVAPGKWATATVSFIVTDGPAQEDR
ncbi:caspase family protein [bacterium]|nr:caspase family protein [bacterium]MBU1675391.1 caspase family protein [bacterium]